MREPPHTAAMMQTARRTSRMIVAALTLAATALVCASPGWADSFGAWKFTSPDEYEREPSDLGVLYSGPRGKFLFLPQAPSGTIPIRDLAQAQIDQIVGKGQGTRREIATQVLPDGVTLSVHMAITNAAFIVAVFQKEKISGTAVFITATSEGTDAEMDALIATIFDPVVLTPYAPSRLPAMDWPAPPQGIVAANRPRMSLAEGRKAGVDPETALLTGAFDCYLTSDRRAPDPRPDLRIESDPGQRYSVTDGIRRSSGTWRVERDESLGDVLQFSDVLAGSGATFVSTNDGLGQTFDIDDPFSDGELTCAQDGPSADSLRQRIAAVAPVKGLTTCTKADGSTFRLMFGNGIYRANGGQGSYVASVEGGYGSWTGYLVFAGGPLDLYEARISDDPAGAQKIDLTQTWHEGSIFYTSSETSTLAECRAPAPKRPEPLYGTEPAAPASAPEGGLPEGYFRSFEGRYSYIGGTPGFNFSDIYTWVGPGGRIIEDPDLDALGDMPDCERTTPGGEEFCGEYRITGGMITRRDPRDFDADAWSDPAPVTLTPPGFRIDDVDYVPVTPPQPDAIIGTWSSESMTGNGPGLQGGVGIYSDNSTVWTFGPDGRFDWHSSTSTTTLISPNPVMVDSGFGGVSGGGGSSSQDGGSGTYRLAGSWLDLIFDDGRTRRITVFSGQPSDDGTRYLTVGGDDLSDR